MDDEYFYVEQTELPPGDQKVADNKALKLQINFLEKFAMRANLDMYKTDTEKDWAYVVRREMSYLNRKAIAISFGQSSLACFFISLATKKITIAPAFVLTPALYFLNYSPLVKSNTRRLFAMLNIGTEFELGAERNRILEECNRITRRADY